MTGVKMQFQGVFTAMITPFDQERNLDLEGLKTNISYQIEQGISGLVILGTTGETSTLSQEEKISILEAAVFQAKGKVPIIAGASSNSTSKTIEESCLAEEIGAQALLIATPYYNRPTQEGIFKHFEAISQAVSIPIIVYNISSRTGQNIETSTLKRIATLDKIVGVKESSGNINQILEVFAEVKTTHPDFSILSGDDSLTLPILSLGGQGVISVISNLYPKPLIDLVEAALRDDFKKARQLHNTLHRLFKAAFLETNPIPIKAMMQALGLPSGTLRLPLCEISSENHRHILETIEYYGLKEKIQNSLFLNSLNTSSY